MAKENKGPVVTKKHLARVERERRQQRLIMLISAVCIALVVILVGWGVVKSYLIEPRQAVVVVDGTEVTSRQFQAQARFTRGQLIDQYAQYYQFMQWFQDDETSQNSLMQTLSQISYQLEPEILGPAVIDNIVENILVRKEAEKRGITVSEDEVEKAMEAYMGYYPGGTPTAEPTEEIKPTSTLSALQQTLTAPTPTLVPTETPEIQTTAEVLTATATTLPEPSPTASVEITPTTAVETGPTATTEVVPTATEYSAKLYNQNKGDYLDYIGINKAELFWIFESQLLRQKLYTEITKDVATETDQVWARQILVADEESAKQVLERLNNGEDFTALVSEVSTDEQTNTKGGDLGWFGSGTFEEEAEKIVFNLEIGAISDPIQTTSGWIIIQVLGHEVRPIPSSDYQQLLDLTYQDWLTNARSAAQVEINDIYVERTPSEPSIPLGLQLGSQ